MITVQLSKEQAQIFAHSIVNDISPYIEAHKKEYEEYANSTEKAAGKEG